MWWTPELLGQLERCLYSDRMEVPQCSLTWLGYYFISQAPSDFAASTTVWVPPPTQASLCLNVFLLMWWITLWSCWPLSIAYGVLRPSWRLWTGRGEFRSAYAHGLLCTGKWKKGWQQTLSSTAVTSTWQNPCFQLRSSRTACSKVAGPGRSRERSYGPSAPRADQAVTQWANTDEP